MLKTYIPHTSSDFCPEDEQKFRIKRLASRLNSPEGQAALAKAAEDTRKRMQELEENCKMPDGFMLRKVTI